MAKVSEESLVLRAARLEAAEMQEACVSISTLASKLPKEQAKIISNAVDTVRANLKSDLESHATSLFVWDNLPGEVKNAIYKLLLVSDEPIRAYVRCATAPLKRFWRKHNLQGQVLLLNKTIYNEALPILLGDNTFILNNCVDKYLGYGLDQTVEQLWYGFGTSPTKRANMVRRLIIDNPQRISPTQMVALRRLQGLKEVIFVGRISCSRPIEQIDAIDWQQECTKGLPSLNNVRLERYVRKHQEVAYYFVGFQKFFEIKESPGVAMTMEYTMKAFKWKLEMKAWSWDLSLITKRQYRCSGGTTAMDVVYDV